MNQVLRIFITLVLCVAITYGCIVSGIDWIWATFFNQHELWVYCAIPFVILGMGVPLAIPLIQFMLFKVNREDQYLILAKKSFWTFLTAYVVMTALKIFSNRVDMEPFEPIGKIDFSNQFRFGFMNSNHWWESLSEGWPSGHTMIAVSMAIVIHSLLIKNWAKVLNIAYPVLIALSVSTAFHWLSDVVSGGIIGIVIGLYFKQKAFE